MKIKRSCPWTNMRFLYIDNKGHVYIKRHKLKKGIVLKRRWIYVRKMYKLNLPLVNKDLIEPVKVLEPPKFELHIEPVYIK